MKIINPFQLNNLEIKKLITLVLFLQFAVFCVIGIDFLNINIPILRDLICFIYLTFVPGILVLRLLKINKLGNIQNILFTMGLSFVTLMFTGFLMNIITFIGINNVFSSFNVIITVSIVILFLAYLCYIKDDGSLKMSFSTIDLSSNELFITLFLFLIPFLSIFGPIVVNIYDNNSIQIIYLIIIAIVPFFVLKWVPKKLYPLTVFVVSLSLLLHTSLISNYVWGADINIESNIANLVLNNMKWDLTIPQTTNAMLGLTILAPIYSIFLNMSVQWVYKIIYPILFSFVPLGLFLVYKSQFRSKIALLSCYFFMASFIFYNGMPALARQELAEIFLSIILILTLMEGIEKSKKYILLAIFGLGMIFSHYGLTYVLIIIMAISLLILKTRLNKYFNISTSEMSYLLINKKVIAIFVGFVLVAYTALASASNIIVVGQIGLGTLFLITKIMDPNYSAALFISTAKMPIFQSIERYIFLGAQAITIVGVVGLIKYKNKLNDLNFKINPDFMLLVYSSTIFAISAMFLPVLSSALQSDRLYHILQFFLAPIFIVGCFLVIDFINKYIIKNNFIKKDKIIFLVTIYLFVFFIFNSALIYEVTGQNKVGSFALDKNVDFLFLNNNEISAAKWLDGNINPKLVVLADVNKANVLSSIVHADNTTEFTSTILTNKTVLNNSYMFFGSYNMKSDNIYVRKSWNRVEYVQIPDFKELSVIYSNNRAYIMKE